MALRVELWTGAGLAGGLEQWWDDVDTWMGADDDRRVRFPIMGSIDPYGFATIPVGDFPALLAELNGIAGESPPAVARIAGEMASLCIRGLGSDTAELRLVGD